MSRADTHRLAAIDIGTVTTRLLVADVSGRSIDVLVREVRITQLGEGLVATGRLSDEAMERVCAAVTAYQEIIGRLGVEDTIAIATSAARDASNSSDFQDRLKRIGIELTIIPGSREASLSFLGAASNFGGDATMVVDIGGGSTEVVEGDIAPIDDFYRTDILASRSFDIGCRRLTDLFLKADPPTREQLEQAKHWVTGQMQPYFDSFPKHPSKVVAVAGTATSVVSMDLEMEVYDSSRVHGAVVTRQTLDATLDRLSALTVGQRRYIVGLDPGRAGIIVAGLVILVCVMELSGLSTFTVSESDILQGIVLDAAHRIQS